MFVRASAKASSFIPIVGPFTGGANVQHEMVMVTFTNNVVSSYTTSYGGNESGVGAASASSADLPAVQADKRPQ